MTKTGPHELVLDTNFQEPGAWRREIARVDGGRVILGAESREAVVAAWVGFQRERIEAAPHDTGPEL
jgi:hypothetical protein